MPRVYPRRTTARTRTRRKASIVRRNARRRPTRRGNRKGILANSRVIRRLDKIQKSHMVYTDYTINGFHAASYIQWHCAALVNPDQFTAVLRQNNDVTREGSTYLRYMTLNLYTWLTNSQAATTWNIYLVRMRKTFGNYNLEDVINNIPPQPAPPAPYWGSGDAWHSGVEFGKVTLNTGMVKVMKHWYYTQSCNRIDTTQANIAGNPASTYRRIQVNIPLKFKISSQYLQSWTSLDNTSIPYYQQVYLVFRPESRDQTVLNSLQWDAVVSAVNYD